MSSTYWSMRRTGASGRWAFTVPPSPVRKARHSATCGGFAARQDGAVPSDSHGVQGARGNGDDLAPAGHGALVRTRWSRG